MIQIGSPDWCVYAAGGSGVSCAHALLIRNITHFHAATSVSTSRPSSSTACTASRSQRRSPQFAVFRFAMCITSLRDVSRSDLQSPLNGTFRRSDSFCQFQIVGKSETKTGETCTSSTLFGAFSSSLKLRPLEGRQHNTAVPRLRASSRGCEDVALVQASC